MIIPLLLIFLPFVLIGWAFRKPEVKGKLGEIFVALRLRFSLDKNIYTVINDVMLPDNQGGTTQIDHIVLSPYGIFVVETKNMQGSIYGDRKSYNWKQYLGNDENEFQNPYKQNYKHIKCLAETTGLPENYFVHIIVFVGSATIKHRDKLPESLSVGATEMLAFIKTHKTRLIDRVDLARVNVYITDNRIANTRDNRLKHVEYVNEIKKQKAADNVLPTAVERDPDFPDPPDLSDFPEQLASPPVIAASSPFCPRCGSPMILRSAKSGANAGKNFWGCSRYPSCRSIINCE